MLVGLLPTLSINGHSSRDNQAATKQPVGNVIGISMASVMMELQVPSKRQSPMGGTAKVGMLWVLMNVESKKQ